MKKEKKASRNQPFLDTAKSLLGLTGSALALASVARIFISKKNEADIERQVADLLSEFMGSVGIYAKDLVTGKTYQYHADESFPAVSLFKVMVMIELFHRAEEGSLSLADRLRVPKAGISTQGPGALKCMLDQPELSLLDYCRLMIIYSDNVATDVLMQVLDPTSITSTLRQLGLRDSRVSGNCTVMNYRMAGIEPPIASHENEKTLRARMSEGQLREAGFADRSCNGNVTTPFEMATILERLARGEIVSEAASARMIKILKQAGERSLIPRFSSDCSSVAAPRMARVWRAMSDAGIVYQKTGPVVISLFAYHDPLEERAEHLIADLARLMAGWARLVRKN